MLSLNVLKPFPYVSEDIQSLGVVLSLNVLKLYIPLAEVCARLGVVLSLNVLKPRRSSL